MRSITTAIKYCVCTLNYKLDTAEERIGELENNYQKKLPTMKHKMQKDKKLKGKIRMKNRVSMCNIWLIRIPEGETK